MDGQKCIISFIRLIFNQMWLRAQIKNFGQERSTRGGDECSLSTLTEETKFLNLSVIQKDKNNGLQY